MSTAEILLALILPCAPQPQTAGEPRATPRPPEAPRYLSPDAIRGLPAETEVIRVDGLSDLQVSSLERLDGLLSLTILGSREPGLSDEGVARLAKLPRLKELRLIWCPGVTDRAMEHLSGLSHLEVLEVSYFVGGTARPAGESAKPPPEPKISDAGLRAITRLANLRSLTLVGARITDEGLAAFASPSPKGLNSLDLSVTPMVGSGLRHLTGLTGLRHLGLDGTRISPEGWEMLGSFPRLTSLDVREYKIPEMESNNIPERDLSPLGRLERLETLLLDGRRIRSGSLASLRGLGHLRRLGLASTPVTDRDLQHLADLKTLEELDLKGTRTTPEGRRKLRGELPNCRITE